MAQGGGPTMKRGHEPQASSQVRPPKRRKPGNPPDNIISRYSQHREKSSSSRSPSPVALSRRKATKRRAPETSSDSDSDFLPATVTETLNNAKRLPIAQNKPGESSKQKKPNAQRSAKRPKRYGTVKLGTFEISDDEPSPAPPVPTANRKRSTKDAEVIDLCSDNEPTPSKTPSKTMVKTAITGDTIVILTSEDEMPSILRPKTPAKPRPTPRKKNWSSVAAIPPSPSSLPRASGSGSQHAHSSHVYQHPLSPIRLPSPAASSVNLSSDDESRPTPRRLYKQGELQAIYDRALLTVNTERLPRKEISHCADPYSVPMVTPLFWSRSVIGLIGASFRAPVPGAEEQLQGSDEPLQLDVPATEQIIPDPIELEVDIAEILPSTSPASNSVAESSGATPLLSPETSDESQTPIPIIHRSSPAPSKLQADIAETALLISPTSNSRAQGWDSPPIPSPEPSDDTQIPDTPVVEQNPLTPTELQADNADIAFSASSTSNPVVAIAHLPPMLVLDPPPRIGIHEDTQTSLRKATTASKLLMTLISRYKVNTDGLADSPITPVGGNSMSGGRSPSVASPQDALENVPLVLALDTQLQILDGPDPLVKGCASRSQRDIDEVDCLIRNASVDSLDMSPHYPTSESTLSNGGHRLSSPASSTTRGSATPASSDLHEVSSTPTTPIPIAECVFGFSLTPISKGEGLYEGISDDDDSDDISVSGLELDYPDP